MVFTTIISFVLIFMAIMINQNLNHSFEVIREFFGENFGQKTAMFINSVDSVKEPFCAVEIPSMEALYVALEYFFLLMIVNTVGMFTSSMQKIIVYRTKDNVTLNFG